jgi:hypothetical protein
MEYGRDELLRELHSVVLGWLASGLQAGMGCGIWLGEAEYLPEIGDLHLDGAVRKSHALGCRMLRAATLKVDSGAQVWVAYDTLLEDSDGCWDAALPTHLCARTAGIYLAGASFTFSAAAGEVRQTIRVRRNGSQILAQADALARAGESSHINITTGMLHLEVGEYVEIGISHDFAGTVSLPGADEETQSNNAAWLARLV